MRQRPRLSIAPPDNNLSQDPDEEDDGDDNDATTSLGDESHLSTYMLFNDFVHYVCISICS